MAVAPGGRGAMSSADGSTLLSVLKTGDLVLFTGQGPARGLFKWFSRTPWTHVGLVLRGPDDSDPLLWEAGCAGPGRGTLVARLAVRMAGFRGRMSVRCLNRPLARAHCQRLDALRQEMAARSRAPGLLDLMGAADDGWLGGRHDNLEPTDAELVAEAYQRLGLLPDVAHGGMPPCEYRPRQFAEGRGLELKNGYALGPELPLHDRDHGLAWDGVSAQPAGA
jgi:hypothetical protein